MAGGRGLIWGLEGGLGRCPGMVDGSLGTLERCRRGSLAQRSWNVFCKVDLSVRAGGVCRDVGALGNRRARSRIQLGLGNGLWHLWFSFLLHCLSFPWLRVMIRQVQSFSPSDRELSLTEAC